jgi:transcriptional regulator with XRE-family HTH domain
MGRAATSATPDLGIGSQIRLHRRRLGLSQLELAQRMGTSQAVVARMEKDGNTNLATVGRALAALGLHGSTHLHHDRPDERGIETDWLSVRLELISGRGEEVHPPAGRQMVVSPRHTLAEFGHAIDVAFGRWDHAHMHCFRFRWQGEFLPAEGGWDAPTDSLTTTIGDLRLRQGDTFVYIFDLGDDHTHLGIVEHTRIDPAEVVGDVPDRPVPIFGWGSIPDQYGRRWAEDSDDETPAPSRERLLQPYYRENRPPPFNRLRRLPLLDADAREALGWPAEEACGGRELASWEEINGMREKLADALPLVSADGRWTVTHLWQSPELPHRSWSCAVCGSSTHPLGASAAAWQGGKGMTSLLRNEGLVCESCLERSEPGMLAFLRALEAPSGANEFADALTIYIEARGGARVVAGEAPVPADLAGRAQRLLKINQALAEGLEASAQGRPERLRAAVDEMLGATDALPASDDELIAGWLRLTDAGLPADGQPDMSLVKSLARHRREAIARYEIVLRQISSAPSS